MNKKTQNLLKPQIFLFLFFSGIDKASEKKRNIFGFNKFCVLYIYIYIYIYVYIQISSLYAIFLVYSSTDIYVIGLVLLGNINFILILNNMTLAKVLPFFCNTRFENKQLVDIVF